MQALEDARKAREAEELRLIEEEEQAAGPDTRFTLSRFTLSRFTKAVSLCSSPGLLEVQPRVKSHRSSFMG